MPGGVTVRVFFTDNTEPRDYDKVKNPQAFIDAVYLKNNNIHYCAVVEDEEVTNDIYYPSTNIEILIPIHL